ncbi:hypothetical protein Q1695_003770 [Nippostrongylus brasiliensis]|nr:hypothetical protein Q1695_003770 [Nippostrongylus brasiliensis]
MIHLKGYITTKILLLTCSTTFACLVFQGMTFSKLATREGSTKRSKYVRDSCFRLCRYLEVKAREAVRELEVGECAFLSGTNWNVVRTQTIECLQKHTSQMENEVMQQQNEGILESDEDQEEKDEKGELIDTRVAFYAILLAHVQDSWVRGELTGKTAHIIVQILEHGIDEGKITADDVEHHLDIIGPNFLDRILFRISEILFTWISYDNWFNEFAEIGDCPLFVVQRTNSIQYVTSRPFEKWWIFQTVISSVICVLLAHANFDDVGEVFRAVIYLLIMLLWLMNVTQTVYIFHKKSKTVQATTSKATSKNDGEKRVGSTFKAIILSKECLPAILACTVLTAAVVLSAIVLNEGYCIRGDNFHTVKCESLRSATFTLVLLFTLYKITRMTPLFVVLLREHTIEKKLMHSRIRLAAVHYLHHVVSAIKISPDLFSSSAYRKARMEAISFDKVIDALLRLDLKENPSNIDVMPVIKTRQAIRMMSYHLQQILNSLSIEGFVPPDSKEKWQEVVNELRDSADAILWVPQIASEDWLLLVKWIRLLRESTKQKVIDILTSAMSYSKVRKLQAGTTLFTEGKKMWFLNKGVCKITEWLPLRSKRRYHVFHVGQGAFLGIRNVLLQNWKGGSLPLMWPRRRYETTTYCEVVEINKDAIVELITAEPSIYKIISNEVQGNRLITELRHMCKKKHQTNANTFWTSFQRYGKSLTKAEQLNVPEGRIGVVGCWTQITLVAPQAALNSHLHIKGPAKLWVEPADPRAPGMVYFEKIRYEEPDDAVADDKSCISLKRYGPKKKLVPSPE